MASIAILPCFTSTYLRRSKRSWSASSKRFKGSQNPIGSCAPISVSKEDERGEFDSVFLTGTLKALAPVIKRMMFVSFISFEIYKIVPRFVGYVGFLKKKKSKK